MKDKISSTKDIDMVDKFVKRQDINLTSMMQLISYLQLSKQEAFDCTTALKLIYEKNEELKNTKMKNMHKIINIKRLRKAYKRRGL